MSPLFDCAGLLGHLNSLGQDSAPCAAQASTASDADAITRTGRLFHAKEKHSHD
jgi:hypothetical protein